MATLIMKHFDVLDFVKKSKELGVSEELATLQARQFEQQQEIIQAQQIEIEAITSKEPATKTDITAIRKDLEIVKLELQKQISDSELRLQQELAKAAIIVAHSRIQTLIWIGVNTAFLLSIMAKGFHWY